MIPDETEITNEMYHDFQAAFQNLLTQQFNQIPLYIKFQTCVAHYYMMSSLNAMGKMDNIDSEFLDIISEIMVSTREQFDNKQVMIVPRDKC